MPSYSLKMSLILPEFHPGDMPDGRTIQRMEENAKKRRKDNETSQKKCAWVPKSLKEVRILRSRLP